MKSLVDKNDPKSGFSFVFGQSADNFFEPKYHFSTGIRLLDTIVGEGGFGSGRISEIFGPNRSGKSEIAQRVAATFLTQYQNGLCFYFDQEMALDKKKLQAVPIFRSERFAICYATTIQALFTKVMKMLEAIHDAQADTPILIIIDSIAMTETDGEAKKALKDVTVAEMGRALSVAMRKIKPIIQDTNAHLLIINQIRHKIGDTYNPEESPGGEALKFACDYRLKTLQLGKFYIRSVDEKTKGVPPDGFNVRVETIKNKRVPPNRVVEIPLLFRRVNGGLNDCWSVFNMFRKEEVGLLRKITGGYSMRHGPHLTDDLIKFKKGEWPGIYAAHADKVTAIYNKWAYRYMLESDTENPDGGAEATDTDEGED